MACSRSRLWSLSQSPSTSEQGSIAQESICVPSMSRNNDLLSFLAVSQFYVVEFVHEQWDQDLGPIGFGASAEVRTRILSNRKEYAFKRHRALNSSSVSLKPESDFRDYEKYKSSHERIFNALVSELTILSHPSVRYHQNFAQIEGIYWENSSDGSGIWPVLVLEKANIGDMWDFGKSPNGQQLALSDRLSICLDIATALLILHQNEIVHGDVKPQNILICTDIDPETQKTLVYARMSDFGYAGWGMDHTAGQLIYLPQSKPWNGPEYHHRAFSIEQAKQLDIYSFGLVCFWFLFHDKSLPGDSEFLPSTEDCRNTSFQWHENIATWIEEMERLKHGGYLLSLVREFVSSESALDDQGKHDLEQLFNHALVQTPQQRKICLDCLSALTGQESISTSRSPYVEYRSIDHVLVGFRVADSYVSLMHGDPKAIKQIALCLKMEALYAAHKTTRESAAFQYAICCKIGFGVPANDMEAEGWLSASGKSNEDWINELFTIKSNVQTRYHSRDGGMLQLGFSGMVRRARRWSDRNDPSGELSQKELDDVINCFGSDNRLVLYLKEELVVLALGQHRVEDAEHLLVRLLDDEANNPNWTSDVRLLSPEELLERELSYRDRYGSLVLNRPDPGSCSPEFRKTLDLVRKSRLNVGGQLANVYAARQRSKEAELVLIESREALSVFLTEDDFHLLRHVQDIGYFYYKSGRHFDAERVFKYLCNASHYTHGKQHLHTLHLQEYLARCRAMSGDYPAAEAILLQLQSQYNHIYKSSGSRVRATKLKLVELYHASGRYKEAANLSKELLLMCKGPSDPNQDTRDTMCMLSRILAESGSSDEVEKIHSSMQRTWDLSKVDRAIRLKCNLHLAYFCCLQTCYKEADLLISDKIEEIAYVTGATSATYRSALDILITIRRSQFRWKEASTACMKYLSTYKGREKMDPMRIEMNGHYALLLTMQCRFSEAAPYLLGLMPWPKAHWTYELNYFAVSETGDVIFPIQFLRYKALILRFLALLLFLGYWSGFCFSYCVVCLDLRPLTRLKRLKNKWFMSKAGEDIRDPFDGPEYHLKHA